MSINTGNIKIEVNDVYKTCDRLQELGILFEKTPDEGEKGMALIKDPSGNFVEILPKSNFNRWDSISLPND